MMSDNSTNDVQHPELSEQERARIRAEMRYAMLVVQEAHPSEKPKSRVEKILGYLSNGFVLLLIGAAITSGLLPHFQRKYENRKQQFILKQECLEQFLLYSNSIWQEYYAILPLTQETDLNKDEYVRYMKEIAQIKLKRYDAFAKVQALAIVFREDFNSKSSPVETSLKKYAVSLNTASAAVDKWLRGIYCTPTKREQSPCANFDPAFDAFSEYEQIKKLVVEIGNNESNNVAALIVSSINQAE